MATDVNKLVIEVTTKNVREAKKDVDALVNSSKELGKTTKDTTEATDKASESTGKFDTALSNVPMVIGTVIASGKALLSIYGSIEDTFVEQIKSQTKLEAIFGTTANAIGYTTDQVESLLGMWRESTGIHQNVTRDMLAIAATFTTVSRDHIPEMVEAGLSMSEVFGQDLKQSIIQLGTSLTNPIEGLGRLRRIGVSFNQEQKDLIKTLMAENNLFGAQQIILDEVNRETGYLADALGETLVGDIKRAESAWTDFKANMGESLSPIASNIRQLFVNMLEPLNKMFDNADSLKSLTAKLKEYYAGLKADPALAGTEISMANFGLPSNVTIQESEAALIDLRKHLKALEKDKANIEDRLIHGSTRNPVKEGEIAESERLIQLKKDEIALYEKQIQLRKDIQVGAGFTDTDYTSTASQTALNNAQTWLDNLREQIQAEKDLQGINSETDPLEKQRIQNLAAIAKLRRAGTELEIDETVLTTVLNELAGIYNENLETETDLTNALNKAKEEQALINGVLDNSNLAMIDAQSILEELYLKDKISVEAYTQALMDLANAQVAPDKEKITSWDGLWDKLIFDTEQAIDWTDSLKTSLEGVAKTALGIGVSGVSDVFANIGASLRSSNEGALTFEQSMLKIVDSTLEAIGPQLMLAGAMHLASPLASERAMGIPLLIAGGAASFLGGLIDSSGGASSSGESNITYLNGYSGETIDPTNSLPLDTNASRGLNLTVNNNVSGANIATTQGPDGSIIIDVISDAVTSKIKSANYTVPVSA